MAVYQFIIELVPSPWVIKNDFTVSTLYDEGGFHDLSLAWKDHHIFFNLSLFSKVLPLKNSWDKNLYLFGEEERHDMQIRVENQFIEEIKIRLDLRDNIDALKEKIIYLAENLRCCFFLPEEKKIIEPDLKKLNDIVSSSRALKFVENPKQFFDDIN